MKKYVTMWQRQEMKAKKMKKAVIFLAIIALFCLAVFAITFALKRGGIKLSKQESGGSESLVESGAGSIPDYSGEDYIILNDGKPEFDAWDMENITGEHYSELDSLGRCGVAYAMLA